MGEGFDAEGVYSDKNDVSIFFPFTLYTRSLVVARLFANRNGSKPDHVPLNLLLISIMLT